MDAIDRTIDASLNRAAEALRVVEDLCRFGWELQGFARELKELRHAVLEAFAPTAADRARVAGARDIEGDVGRRVAVAPLRPLTPEDLAARNLERAKEALRTLEEAGRQRLPEAGAAAGQLRYRLYAVEKGILALLAGGDRSRLIRARLYLIASEDATRFPLLEAVQAALEGGAGAVQLREKRGSDRRILEIGRGLREVTARAGVPFLVNDRPDLALLLGADGVHLGQTDLPVGPVRRLLGEERVIGVSTHSPEQALHAAREGADYIGAGPVFATATKEAGAPIGPEGLRRILEAADLPAFAIGGIRPENVRQLPPAGARHAAVSSGVLGAPTLEAIREAARAIVEGLAPPGG